MPKQNNNIMIIIDAQAVLHRSWHALPKSLTDKSKKPINAAYGFVLLLLKLLEQYSPQNIAVAFDTKGKTFRHKTFKEYKANREKQPQEFYNQIPKTKEILKGFNIPTFSKKGFEADDIIASIIKDQKEKKSNKKFLIVTGDLDLSQLIDKQTSIYFLKQGVTGLQVYDKQGIQKRFNVKPEQIIDFKALCGDSSDNIPGAPGIGPKTAARLLKDYNNLDNIFKNIDNCKEKVQKTILENKEQIKRAQKLVQLKHEIKDLDFDKIKDKYQLENDKAIETLKKFNFKSLIKRIYKLDKKQGNLF